jgi:hypothetical protein
MPRASGPTHGAPSAGKTQPKEVSASKPSDIALFITNLRLLDLDRSTDWPGITPQTFNARDGQQNQKLRVRCVEWALYRLFELYDANEAREVSLRILLDEEESVLMPWSIEA